MMRQAPARGDSTLLNRNVRIAGRRTSLRLEPPMWEALSEVARAGAITIHELCTLVDENRRESSLTAAIRVFLLRYFRAQADNGGQHSVAELIGQALRYEPASSGLGDRVENSGQ